MHVDISVPTLVVERDFDQREVGVPSTFFQISVLFNSNKVVINPSGTSTLLLNPATKVILREEQTVPVIEQKNFATYFLFLISLSSHMRHSEINEMKNQ